MISLDAELSLLSRSWHEPIVRSTFPARYHVLAPSNTKETPSDLGNLFEQLQKTNAGREHERVEIPARVREQEDANVAKEASVADLFCFGCHGKINVKGM